MPFPLNYQERIEAWTASRGIAGGLNAAGFTVILAERFRMVIDTSEPTALQFQGIADLAEGADTSDAARLANDINQCLLFPAVVIDSQDHVARLMLDQFAPLGLTDEQLDEMIDVALTSVANAVEAIDSIAPGLIATKEA